MMTTVILIGSALLAGGFVLMWLFSPTFRRRIERPKHLFADQVRQYDSEYSDPNGVTEAKSSDS